MDLHFSANHARCIQPASVALVGASARAGSCGRRTMAKETETLREVIRVAKVQVD